MSVLANDDYTFLTTPDYTSRLFREPTPVVIHHLLDEAGIDQYIQDTLNDKLEIAKHA